MGWGLWFKWVLILMEIGNWSLGGRSVTKGDVGTKHELVRAFETLGEMRGLPITISRETKGGCEHLW